ncbi:MAG: FIG022979: MoxR-like ATPases [uncultured Gemmatimonadetes bacterium]|uniref:FIG022979: MoxR-like ATPases n=1 Tax=uncultured Gemmatimonadota bacterium TaxID=203437 RepID=A0A6J4KWM1_9BACT|nr:MAG: FIG022979: MoxR-like ATPases [uncultured Gemmatimonadota bacterium]
MTILDTQAASGDRAQAVLDRLGGVVLGQEEVLRHMMVALLAGGHALMEGVPGTAKTLSIRSLALALELRFGRVQFTPDLMPTDLVGVNMLDELKREFVYHPGPIFTDLLLADEINRAPAKTQAALLEAMAERQVTVDGRTRPLPAAFTVFASQNPVEYEGTYPLPEAQLDRFLLKIVIDYPGAEAERAILDRYADGFSADRAESYGLQPMMSSAELAELRRAVAAVHVEPSVRDYITRIVRATRDEPTLALGASPRASVALFLASRAEALLAGRDFVTPDDVKALALPVLRHRVTLTPEAEVEGRTVDERLTGLLQTLPAPSR